MRTAVHSLIMAALLLAAGCGGVRMKWLTEERPAPLPDHAPVEIYVGRIEPSPIQIAIIETTASPYNDEQARREQLEQLRRRARRVGANAVQDTRILAKDVRGFTLDERTPFFSWRQGRYALYFMRGTAVVTDPAEPFNLEEIEPPEGWLVDALPMPRRLPDE